MPAPRHSLTLAAGAVPSTLIALAFNRLARAQGLDQALCALNGRVVGVDVTGPVPLALAFQVRGADLRAGHGFRPHVTISGHASEFVRLAARLEDADTLFFQRRLRIQGDTECGMHVKNLLDALDLDPDLVAGALLGQRPAALLARPLALVRDAARHVGPVMARWLDAAAPAHVHAAPDRAHASQAMPGNRRQ